MRSVNRGATTGSGQPALPRIFATLGPVAVLTTDGFDVGTVDPNTVEFAGASPVRWTLEDVDSDGDLDLLFHFKMQELSLTNDSTTATLTGDTYGGQAIEGTDTVNIVPKGKNKDKK